MTPTNDSEVEDELGLIFEAWDKAETTDDCNTVIDQAKTAINRLLIKRALEELQNLEETCNLSLTASSYVMTRIETLDAELKRMEQK